MDKMIKAIKPINVINAISPIKVHRPKPRPKHFLPYLLASCIALICILGSRDMPEVKAENTTPTPPPQTAVIQNTFEQTDYSNILRNCIPENIGICRTSFLEKRPNNGYQAAIYHQGKIYIQNFSDHYQLESSQELDLELPLWGGLFFGNSYNYVICGKEHDAQAEAGGEVYRIIQYSKEFERIASLSLNSEETYTATPFYWGTVSIDEQGDTLTVYTSRLRPDGKQSNIAIHINTTDMTVSDRTGMAKFPAMHQQDSFRQLVKYDAQKLLYVDVSEEDGKSKVFLQFGETKEIVAEGEDEYNNTKDAELSGLAVSDTHYLVVGSCTYRSFNNIFLSSVDKNSGKVERQWLTDAFTLTEKYAHNPRIVKITEDQFAILWGSRTTQYILVDGRGNIISERKESPVPITDCEPIYADGKIICFSVEDGTMALHEITDFSLNGIYKPEISTLRSGLSWDGTADISWYDDSKMEFDISTAQQLCGLAELANKGNTFEGKRINLCQDIFLNDGTYQYMWKPIAAYWGDNGYTNVFQGEFYGNGHTIYNIRTGYRDGGGGLFGRIGEKGIVKCVNVSQGMLHSGGCIADVNDGVISFCNNYSTVGVWDLDVVGGICNKKRNLVYGCKNYGEVWGSMAAGIVGSAHSDLATISQCSNYGLVSGTEAAAGIVAKNRAWVFDCYNKGIVAERHWRNGDRICYLSGIAYENLDSGHIANCYSAGVFSYTEKEGLPRKYGICGKNEGGEIAGCYALSGYRQDNQGAGTATYEELASPSFVPKLNQRKYSLLPVWKEDIGHLNDGLPITAADESFFTGQCKIQPELWITGNENGVEADLEAGTYVLTAKYYYNDSDPVLTIEDAEIAEIAEISDVSIIRLKKTGTTYINIHFDETENNSSADYRLMLKIKSKNQSITGTPSYSKTYGNAPFKLDAALEKGNGTLSYASSNPKVAEVSDSGEVTITGAGNASITVTASETEDYRQCEYQISINVAKAVQRISGTAKYSKAAGSKPFRLNAKRTAGDGKLSYLSSNRAVATVSDNGTVTIKKPGSAIITITAATTVNYSPCSFRINLSVTAPKKGTILTDSKTKAKYKVSKQGKAVEYVKPEDKMAVKVSIPATVTISGVKYNVTAIASNAFSGCKKLKSITIGKNVESIGTKAFANCTALGKLTLPAKASKIGKQAFFGCKKLKDIAIKSTKLTAKSIGAKAFQSIHAKATIKVPKAKKAAYQKLLKSKGMSKKVKIK